MENHPFKMANESPPPTTTSHLYHLFFLMIDIWFWTCPALLCVVLPAETEHGQKVSDMDAAQQLKLKERQRFFEEVFQHDVDVYLSSAHLTIRDYRRRELTDNTHTQSCKRMHVHTHTYHENVHAHSRAGFNLFSVNYKCLQMNRDMHTVSEFELIIL